MNSLRAGFFCLLMSAASALAQSPNLPAEVKITGQSESFEGGIRALPDEAKRVTAKLEGPIPNPLDSLLLTGKTGSELMGVTFTFLDAAGKKTSLLIRAQQLKLGETIYPDAMIALGWTVGWGRYYVKPYPGFYKPEEIAKRKADWDKLPGASTHSFHLELRPVEDSILEVWFDHQLMNRLQLEAPMAKYEIDLAPGASIESLKFAPPPASLTLPIRFAPRMEGRVDARLEFDPKARVSAAFKELSDGKAQGISVGGLGTFPGLGGDDLVSYFWRRHAVHNLPEQRMFSIPLAVYSHATLLAALNSKPGTVPEMTFRVTRYGGSRGDAMADTTVRLPVGETSDDPNISRVGTLIEGDKRTPLWLIKVPIKNGLIEDLIHSDGFKDGNIGTSEYLDVELLDPLANTDSATNFPTPTHLTNRAYRPSQGNPESGVMIFGVEMERSPADLTVRSNLGFQAFYRSDNPEFIAKVSAVKSGKYLVEWKFADISGKIVDSGSQEVTVEAGQEQAVKVPVRSNVGWYSAQFRLLDSKKIERVDYRTSFVLLPPDTRKAGLESPFYGWWFQKNQRSDVKLEEVGPLLQRAGIRRVGLPPDMPESATLKYGFTESTIDWRNARLAMLDYRDGKKTLPEAIAAQEASIKEALELWPHADRMLVFHESGSKGAPFPSEIWGEPAKSNRQTQDENSPEALLAKEGGGAAAEASTKAANEWQQNWPRRIEYLTAMSKMVREKFPQLKMQYGNDGNSLGLMGELFRQKFPREFMDTIAVEDLGQTFAPERALIHGFQSAWFLKETAKQMGYGDIPITACTEWIGRMTERLGLQKQAEWKVRDGLLALVYGFDTISIAGINDAGSGYYFTNWANGGLCFRYPTMAPKPAYAAIAALTQVLDQAKFQRFVPTGSTVVYAAEFKRGEQWVYAIWTPRGDRKVTLEFANGESRTLTDLYGRTRELKGAKIDLTASTAAQYIESKNLIVSFKVGEASFPEDLAPKETEQVIPFESLSEVSIVSNPAIEQAAKARPETIPQLREGEFEIREVVDEVMGKCLEVELKPTRELRWPMEHEVVTLQLKTPVTTSAQNAGVWIKGNGSWGEVDIRKTASGGPWSTSGDILMRWPGNSTLNFDGWNLITYPSNGTVKKDNVVQGLQISLPRQTLYGTDMVPVENLKVRIKNLILF